MNLVSTRYGVIYIQPADKANVITRTSTILLGPSKFGLVVERSHSGIVSLANWIERGTLPKMKKASEKRARTTSPLSRLCLVLLISLSSFMLLLHLPLLHHALMSFACCIIHTCSFYCVITSLARYTCSTACPRFVMFVSIVLRAVSSIISHRFPA
ncbi:hypothetical protein EV424DRAFT_1439057, partial [Suillus variegatus]